MTQTITSVAVLGTRYLSGIQYRVLDTSGDYYPGPADNLANGTHLGQGIWRAVVTLPDAGGEVRWSQGASILAVDVVEPVPGAVAGETVAAAVWTYTSGDRSLTGPQSAQLTGILEQLKSDYFKGDTRFIRYRQGTLEIILDKDVTFNPDAGYTITEHQ